MTEENKVSAMKAKEEGNAFYKLKRFDEAIACYTKASELDPLEMTYLTNKAAVYFEQKKYDDVISECEKAIEIGQENRADFKLLAKAYARMAGAFHKKEDLDKAKFFYQKSLTEHRTPDTRSKLSEVEKALKEQEKLAYINPEKSQQEKDLGNEFFKKGNYPSALSHYNEAIKRNPSDAKVYSNRAACYQKLAEFGLALKDCEECIRLEPTFVRGHIRKGMALFAMKEYSRASTAYSKVLEMDPTNGEAYDGIRKCNQATALSPEESRKQAMADPEVQAILGDPAMRMILEQMQSDPMAAQDHLKNPEVARKIEKLLDAGLIGMK